MDSLNDYLFEQMDRLNELDVSDRDALAAEVRRSHALCEVGKGIIQNARNAIDATRLRDELSGTDERCPRMLDA